MFTLYNVWCWILTSSYMNCNVRADFPTPPLPTIITLCITAGCCVFALDMVAFGFPNPKHLNILTEMKQLE